MNSTQLWGESVSWIFCHFVFHRLTFFSDHLLGVNPLSVQGRHLLDRITFYASQFGLKSVECVKKNLIFVFLWKVERESEKWKNRIKAAAQKKDGGTFLPWPPSILETMDSGHQRHCTPPKPLLRLTKNILKNSGRRKLLRLFRQILTQHIIISFWWASFCIVVLLWTWGAGCIGKYMYELPDPCLIQQHRCLEI